MFTITIIILLNYIAALDKKNSVIVFTNQQFIKEVNAKHVIPPYLFLPLSLHPVPPIGDRALLRAIPRRPLQGAR